MVFSIAQWVSATWISVELTDIVASLAGIAAAVVLLRFWQPRGTAAARERLLKERAVSLVGAGTVASGGGAGSADADVSAARPH